MVKHIVLWKLKETGHEINKKETAFLIKKKLEALNGKIKGMRRLEVGIDFSNTDTSSDLALYAEFLTRADLEAYQNHPEHRAIMPFIMEARSERRIADYEI